MTTMRAKFILNTIAKVGDQEQLIFSAVSKSGAYPADGLDEDNTYAKFSPSGSLSLTVANPNLIGKFEVGQKFYLDFTPCEE